MEQFHGPTCAFKDVALQFVGNMFEFFLSRRAAAVKDPSIPHDPDTPTHITVVGATSGDTGSAAIEGLRGKANIEYVDNHFSLAVFEAMSSTNLRRVSLHWST